MTNLNINIALDFSDAPGARFYSDGPDSGQEFYDKLLKPKFEEALKSGSKLIVDMDGTFGYATSFISASFGVLSKNFSSEKVLNILDIKSDEDPEILNFTINTIKNPNTI